MLADASQAGVSIIAAARVESRTFSEQFTAPSWTARNRQKPSGIAAKADESRVHLVPQPGSTRLHAIGNEPAPQASPGEQVTGRQQRVDGVERAAKAGRGVGRDRQDALCDTATADPRSSAGFYDFDEYERLVEASKSDLEAYLVALVGGGGWSRPERRTEGRRGRRRECLPEAR